MMNDYLDPKWLVSVGEVFVPHLLQPHELVYWLDAWLYAVVVVSWVQVVGFSCKHNDVDTCHNHSGRPRLYYTLLEDYTQLSVAALRLLLLSLSLRWEQFVVGGSQSMEGEKENE